MENVSPVDLAALELLAASRKAAEQETSDRARAIHEQSLQADETLTLISQLGYEAIRLYEMFEMREAYFMGPKTGPTLLDNLRTGIFDEEGRKYNLAHQRRARKYGAHILQERDGEISVERAYDLAYNEITRVENENEHNRTLRRYGFGDQKILISTSYEYFSPPLLQTNPEIVEEVSIIQQWRVKASLPCTYNMFNKTLTTLHEFKYNDERKSTRVHHIVITPEADIKEVTERTSEGEKALEESELFFPLGLLIAAREAVYESVPQRTSKKW